MGHRIEATLGPALSGDLSTLFDVGGIVGGIAAGVVSDYTGMYATTCSVMLTFAAPMLFVYEKFGTYNFSVNIILLLIAGLLVNGPYALITTAVSAELGTHHSLQGNSKALATVTAIIDGTGSIGSCSLDWLCQNYGSGFFFDKVDHDNAVNIRLHKLCAFNVF
uniref:Major facilitator superfamily (MFS) profile domain-containing protein n=1 Tax=Timema cristinae TaxID=61476 RepID=A0A7R9D033_TIMCR|nr:unnamed protein product [Timema cristinae]